MAPPSVLVGVLDSVRASNAFVTKHHQESLPALRRWHREHGGVQYTNARAPAIWSYPSHVSLFTGLPAAAHRVDSDEILFDPTAETVFDRIGHETAVFSTNPSLADAEWNLQNPFDADTGAALRHSTETPSDAGGLTDRDGWATAGLSTPGGRVSTGAHADAIGRRPKRYSRYRPEPPCEASSRRAVAHGN